MRFRMLSNLINFKENYFTLEPWKRWCGDLLSQLTDNLDKGSYPWLYYKETREDRDGESPAVEVMKYKQKDGYFSSEKISS